MKRLETLWLQRAFFVLVIAVSGLTVSSYAQPSDQPIEDYLKQCDFQSLISKFAPDIEMCIFDEREYIGQRSVVSALNNFLKGHPCSSFTIKHKGNDPKYPNKEFLIGRMLSNSEDLKFTIFIRNGQILEITINYPKN